MKKLKFGCRKLSVLVGSVVLAAVAILFARKIIEYASPPLTSRDCDFRFPNINRESADHTVVMSVRQAALSFEQLGGYVNDASCLNKTPVYGVVRVSKEQDVANALVFARTHRLKITAAGQQHSMGGQSFYRGGLVLDMKPFNRIALDRQNNVLHVEAGATWGQIQDYLDKQGLSVKAMQSYNVFTVGGALSVNAHGITRDPGAVASTVRSIRIMKSDGQIVTASATESPDLFKHVIGGYGLFGVILEADLDVVENQVYVSKTAYMDYKDFPAYYRDHVENNGDIGLFYARLSVAPGTYLKETVVHTYVKMAFHGSIPAMHSIKHPRIIRLVFDFSKTGSIGRWTRWFLEKHIGVDRDRCISRNQVMSKTDDCWVSRNQEMDNSTDYLHSRLEDIGILQEYFVPQDRMTEFVDGLRRIVVADGANLLNVTIRGVDKDSITALPYAKQDSFAFVLYFSQKPSVLDSRILEKATVDLISLAIELNGTFYLPYQLYYSPAQLRESYPEIDAFFAAKKKNDPVDLFDNTFYAKYSN